MDDLSTGGCENVLEDARFYELDVRSRRDLAEAFAVFRSEVPCHQATQMDVRHSVRESVFDADVNVLDTLRILQNCVENGVAETRIALGRVVAVNPDKDVIVMRADREAQDGERMVFRIKKNAEITLDGEKADVEAIKEDQQVQIEYISKEKLDRAISVSLFAVEQKPEEDGGNEEGGGSG